MFKTIIISSPPNSSIFELDPSNTQNGDLGINNVILSGMGGVSYKTNNY